MKRVATALRSPELRALIYATAGLAGTAGILISDEIPDLLIALLIALGAFLESIAVRHTSMPNENVVMYLPEKTEPDIVKPGPAVVDDCVSDTTIARLARTDPEAK